MMIGRSKSIGQAIIEYSALIAISIAALVVMQIYLKRSFGGYFKQNTDRFSGGQQFSPELSRYTQVTKSSSKTQETVTEQGQTENRMLEDSITQTEPFMDDFSDKKLTEEKLFK